MPITQALSDTGWGPGLYWLDGWERSLAHPTTGTLRSLHGHEHEHAQRGRGGRDHLAGRRVRHVLPRRRVNNVAFTSTNKLEAANKARFHLHYLERLAL
ncbi:hypothetical protein BJ912DRAFT_1041248 [Pholiota molesta]|nr:hypothetical protein BJ912DRAFT_1041248 [Pholiota molesta]